MIIYNPPVQAQVHSARSARLKLFLHIGIGLYYTRLSSSNLTFYLGGRFKMPIFFAYDQLLLLPVRWLTIFLIKIGFRKKKFAFLIWKNIDISVYWSASISIMDFFLLKIKITGTRLFYIINKWYYISQEYRFNYKIQIKRHFERCFDQFFQEIKLITKL